MKRNLSAAFFLVAAPLGLLFLNSCAKGNSSEVNQNSIYTRYEVFYNENSDKTWVSAKFTFGGATGTALELDSTAYVTFGTDTLPYTWWCQCHFKEYAGRISTGSFKYHNLNNVDYVNPLPSVDTLSFQAGFDTLHKNSANTVTWVGSPLVADEAVSLFVGTWVWGQDALGYQDGDGATNVILGVTQMSSTSLGGATVYMDRAKQIEAPQHPQEGGIIRHVYRPTNATVQVVN